MRSARPTTAERAAIDDDHALASIREFIGGRQAGDDDDIAN
jgi:hypothetical protein